MDKEKRSLQQVVDEKAYTVWTIMLRRLVPNSRTHRIAPFAVVMLRDAVLITEEQ